jgi:hypothetical protein
MTKIVATLFAAAAATVALAAPAVAASRPIPTTSCELQEFLGFDNVMACEGVDG